ncbi:MAG TPA: MarR family winged helix-turn-helix transcriptional regulator [Acetobacteraceae bacterium]|nr:MarR family winged helix-turn-helix transcriptional regulator [Acetobacteraceae bacterium]
MKSPRPERRTSAQDELCNCTVLRKAARRVSFLYDRALAPSGLRITQYAILAELGRSGPMTITDLARAMVMERNGLGHNLRPLEREGLIRMEVGQDRRSRVIVVTEKGHTRLAEARPLWRQGQERFAAVFGPDQARTLRSLLVAATAAEYSDPAARLGTRSVHP